jgi:UPF0716 protein FxsA
MGPLLFVLFVVVPLVELALLVYIGTQIGILYTVGIVIFTALLGAILAPRQGARAWAEIVAAWRGGRVPGIELVAGALFLVGAAFLITPGVLTDIAGLLLMVPAVRRGVGRGVVRFFRRRARILPKSEVLSVRRVD